MYLNKFINLLKNSIKLEFLVFLLIFIVSIYSYLIIFTDNFFSPYAYNELFINYQTGLIRRGLLGEIFWQLNNYFLVNPKIFFGLIFYFLYITQIYFFYYLLKNYKNFYILIIILILAPQLILFPIYDTKVFFLKDIFVKISILLHGYMVFKLNENEYINFLKKILIPVIAAIILIHEYQVLFVGVHLLITLNFLKKKINQNKILKYYSILILPIIFIFIFIGNQEQYDNLNLILKSYNVELHPQLEGGFKNLLGGFYKWHFFYFTYRDFINLFVSFFLSIIIIFLIFENFIQKKIIKIKKNLRKSYLLFFIPTILCFLTLDHGRNISLVSTHLLVFYLSLNLNKKNLILLNNKLLQNFNLLAFFIFFTFMYVFLWKLDQYAGFGLQGKEFSIFKSSLFAELIKLIKFIYSFIDIYIFDLPDIEL